MKNAVIQMSFEALIDDKIDELREKIKFFKSDACELSKNTKSTQLSQRNRELRVLRLIKALLNDDVTDNDRDTLISITMTASERNSSVVDFNEGEMLMDILKRYKDVKNIYAKINRVCERKGLGIDYTQDGLIIKN